MLFSTGTFWLFFPLVFALLAANRWLLRSIPVQNAIILAASYVFYGWWDWRFLGLIVASTLLDYGAAIAMERSDSQKARRRWLHLSVVGNLGILGYFKYFEFFGTELKTALVASGFDANWETLDIILPVGISFYTLQTLSYSIDVYHGRFKAERNLLRYATYVAFFPQLVAGPIERAADLIPQFGKLAKFSWTGAYRGTCLIIAGLFMKVVIADNLAPIVDEIFANYRTLGSGELWLGTLYFCVQIYSDFAGYSTIAIGLAAIMGFVLSKNFDAPLTRTSITGLWRNWNITLTLFFRDYVGSLFYVKNAKLWQINAAAIATFAISGLWHGANWTFILWGGIHGAALSIERIVKRTWLASSVLATSFTGWLWMMSIKVPGAVWFRSPTFQDAAAYTTLMLSDLALPHSYRTGMLYVAVSYFVDFLWRDRTMLNDGLNLRWLGSVPRAAVETSLFAVALILVLVNVATRTEPNAFIYFQF